MNQLIISFVEGPRGPEMDAPTGRLPVKRQLTVHTHQSQGKDQRVVSHKAYLQVNRTILLKQLKLSLHFEFANQREPRIKKRSLLIWRNFWKAS